MLQNWINLLSNFKMSSTNMLFCLLVVGIFIVLRLWTQFVTLSGRPDPLATFFGRFVLAISPDRAVDNAIRGRKQDTSSIQRELDNFLPASQGSYSVTPIEIKQTVNLSSSQPHKPNENIWEEFEVPERPSGNVSGTGYTPVQLSDDEASQYREVPKNSFLLSSTFSQEQQVASFLERELADNILPQQSALTKSLISINSSNNSPEETSFNNQNKINILRESKQNVTAHLMGDYVLLDSIEENKEDLLNDNCQAEAECETRKVFQLLLDVKGSFIQRTKYLQAIKRSFQNNSVVFLIGQPGLGKSHLASVYAKDLNANQNVPVLSLSLNQSINSLNEALTLLLIEGLKVEPSTIDNPVQAFFKIVSSERFLLIFNNIELLPLKDLMLLCNCNFGLSQALLLSGSLSTRSLNQLSQSFRACVIELEELDLSDTYHFLLERLPLGHRLDQNIVGKLSRFIKGNPLALNLFCNLADVHMKRSPDASIENLLKVLDSCRISSDKTIPISLYKILTLTFKTLSEEEKIVLFLCSHLPLGEFSAGFIEKVFHLSAAQTVQLLDSLAQKGLLHYLGRHAFQEPRFAIHSTVKDFIYKEFRVSGGPQEAYLNDKLQEVSAYFAELLDQKDKLKKENTIFICEGLSYVVRLLSGDFSRASQYGIFLEKTVNYFYSLSLMTRIQEHIIPVYEDKLKMARTQEERAFWQRLLGLCLMMQAMKLNLGNGFESKELSLEKTKQLQAGIDLLEQSLSLYAGNFAPANCLQLHSDLGNAYLNLAEVGCVNSADQNAVNEFREEKLIKAIEHFKKAVQLQNVQKNSIDYIICHISLGNAYLKIYQVKPNALTLHLSVQILARAIQSFGAELDSRMRASIHQNIANALRNLANHEAPQTHLEAAINEYKAALAEPEVQDKALIYNSLGCCFWKLAKLQNPVYNMQTSIRAYKKCLEALHKQYGSFASSSDTLEYAVTLNNVGTTYKALALLQDPESNLNFAIKAFRESLRIADKLQDQKLSGVINKHLLELHKLLENIASKHPDKRMAVEEYQVEIRRALSS